MGYLGSPSSSSLLEDNDDYFVPNQPICETISHRKKDLGYGFVCGVAFA